MKPLEFDHQLRKRMLNLRQNLNRSAQCMNHNTMALQNALLANEKARLRLELHTNRLALLLRHHGI